MFRQGKEIIIMILYKDMNYNNMTCNLLMESKTIVSLFVFNAIPASMAIFMARNIMAELYHVFIINFC